MTTQTSNDAEIEMPEICRDCEDKACYGLSEYVIMRPDKFGCEE